MATVDLHLHTTASDGRLTPTQLVNLAVKRGLEIIAITDHDTTEGLAEAQEAARAFPGLRLVPGAELSVDLAGNDVHLLAYFIDPNHSGLQAALAKYRFGRVGRGRKMVEKLQEQGVLVDWERVVELAGDGSVGRPHVALAMVEKGYIERPEDAFVDYLGSNGSAYVEREKLSPQQSVQLIQEAEGVTVLAHPSYISDLDNVVEELKSYGLVGMEVYYAQYDAETIATLGKVAARHGMLACGGSDYHALGNLNEPLPGELGPPPAVVKQLEQLARASRSGASHQ